MKKRYCYGSHLWRASVCILLAATPAGFLSSLSLLPSGVYAQSPATPGITLDVRNMSVPAVLQEIRKQAGLRFIYDLEELKKLPPVSMRVKNASLDDVLNKILGNAPLSWSMEGGVLMIRRRVFTPEAPQQPAQQQFTVHGTVTDENRQPLEKVTIQDLKARIGVFTDEKGNFEIATSADATLQISYIGMEPQVIPVKGRNALRIALAAKNNTKEVVVTGMFTRKRESFTGAAASFTGGELKTVGNQNILQSLKTLDPSFRIVENNVKGANPNALPSIEVRGKSSLISVQTQTGTDANQPLFILDGFETTLQVVNDLDMNRVAAITVLKDAASTALYGARAANGVVVIETLKPRPGAMRVSYTYDFRVEAPDLTSYNMMNAAEKLEYERLAGRYIANKSSVVLFDAQNTLDELYAKRLAAVRRGVNTYWLSEPLRTGITNGHALYAEGGDNQMRYGVGLNYKDLDGVMKGSGRNTWGANVDLQYRKGKFNISNKLYLNGYRADESPYGSFSDWVKVLPYFKKTQDDGTISPYLDIYITSQNQRDTAGNPLYNATLNSYNYTKEQAISNNLQLIYDINTDMRITGGVNITGGNTTTTAFLSPSNTAFIGKTAESRGTYDYTNERTFGYNSNLMFSYGKLISNMHQLNLNARGEIREDDYNLTSFKATGFPVGAVGNPAFAYGYEKDGIPGYSKTTKRSVAALATASYMFDRRLLLDASWRIDGSTSFGTNNKYSPFWSAGIGYNLHNDIMFKQYRWINLLKIRANIGLTGNQNFQNLSSETIYAINAANNQFGQGYNVSSLGNPNLKWQNSLAVDIGADMAFLQNRISLTVDYYKKNTDPLIAMITTPSSTGISAYPFNIGYQHTKGVDWNFKVTPIFNAKKNIYLVLGFTGRYQESIYGGFNNMLEKQNELARTSNSLQRFRDGNSPDAIWAVRSAGIDPGTGAEVFIKKNGTQTFDYDASDEVVVGNLQPKMEGVLSANLRVSAFSFGANIRYTYGGDAFNSALYDRIENISTRKVAEENLDKRALYERWKQPGDVAQFKAINNFSTVKMTSRYVQRNNYLSGESINVSYELLNKPWMRHAGLSVLRFSGYTNDVFRLATIKSERGTEYPFSNSYSFSVRATF
ncbi:SusC/RagA family TonB-linked outer membrane protein [Chitinophaga ginsengisoli]|uniref:TonB-linked SusC/RagA family outer membrane protein n=1 Tax=Chitinophaga ginsengisoli TaxID=363837 RepID=A0A2P8GE43_9BACT|nr:SusC/RagA family TonB-linked outer membrane protein [Chitinophaga ginsengisoli]PSL32226.1 TonB-linked SusC/RagA family outer membrane protein [Chitinophaga ginsengisoli]